MRRVAHKRPSFVNWLHFAQAFRSQPFTLLWVGQTISVLGDAVFNIAIAWEVLLLTGSATAMSLIIIAQWAPKLVFLLPGGVIADRISRRFLMLCADLGRGCIVVVIAWLSQAHLLQFWHLIALAPLFGILSSFFEPAYQAIMTQLVETEALASVNSLNTLSRNIGFLLGPALGAICATLLNMTSAFALDGLTYIISAICLLILRLPSSLIVPQSTASASSDAAAQVSQNAWSPIRDIREGLGYVFSVSWLWVTLLASPLVGIGFAGAMWVTLPRLVRDVYGAGIWLIGAVATADALGSILAALMVGNARKLLRGIVAYSAILVGGLALVACAVPLPRPIEPIVALVAGTLIGAGVTTFMILWGTLQQEHVPNDKLGRVSSITQLGVASTLPGGLVLAGLLADHVGPAQVFALAGVLVVVPAAIGLSIHDIRQLQ
jgi:MFS family permease